MAGDADSRRGPEAAALLQLLGAAVGLGVFFTLVGALLRGVAFAKVGLPAERAVGLVSRDELLSVGANALLPWVVWGILATLFLTWIGPLYTEGETGVEPEDVGKPRKRFLGALVVLLLAPALWIAVGHNFDIWPGFVVTVAVVLIGEAAVWLMARGPAGVRSVGWLVFVIVVAVGGVLSYLRTWEKPKLEPAAVILSPGSSGLSGFIVGENANAIYLAPLAPSEPGSPVVPERDIHEILEIPRAQVVALRVAPLAGLGVRDSGPEEARALLDELKRQQKPQGEQPPAIVKTENPIAAFAPLVHLHADDPSFPTTSDFFLANSSLLWAQGGKCPPFSLTLDAPLLSDAQRSRIIGDFDRTKLGDGGYARPVAGPGCRGLPGAVFRSNQPTRPGQAHDRPAGLPLDQGFSLDLANGARNGEGRTHVSTAGGQATYSGVPVYYEEERSGPLRRLTYWFFLPLSVPPGPSKVTGRFIHEGDWERVSVLVRRGPEQNQFLPVSVRYYIHDGYQDRIWSNVETASDNLGQTTHPVVYSGRGSHASYPRSGDFTVYFGGRVFPVTDRARACPACPIWSTWDDLVSVRDEPWYGFGGAWGEVRPANQGGTGPLGPSPSKLDTLGLEAGSAAAPIKKAPKGERRRSGSEGRRSLPNQRP